MHTRTCRGSFSPGSFGQSFGPLELAEAPLAEALLAQAPLAQAPLANFSGLLGPLRLLWPRLLWPRLFWPRLLWPILQAPWAQALMGWGSFGPGSFGQAPLYKAPLARLFQPPASYHNKISPSFIEIKSVLLYSNILNFTFWSVWHF